MEYVGEVREKTLNIVRQLHCMIALSLRSDDFGSAFCW